MTISLRYLHKIFDVLFILIAVSACHHYRWKYKFPSKKFIYEEEEKTELKVQRTTCFSFPFFIRYLIIS